MAFLIRRGKRATAGWVDNFTRPNELYITKPWQYWGNSATFSLVNQQLRLAAPGETRGGNYDGGVAFEHQPLTKDWCVEFIRAPIGTTAKSASNETEQVVFLDKNWTEGGNASSTLYQVSMQLQSNYTKTTSTDSETGEETTTETMSYYIRIRTRDKVNTSQLWGFTIEGSIGGDSEPIPAAQWAGALRIRLHIYNDRYIVGYINNVQQLFADMYKPEFQFGPRKRSANFAQVSGLIASIDEFKTYDLPIADPGQPGDPGIRDNWTPVFYDSFNRANSTSVGNGWTQTTGNAFGIWANGLSMQLGAFNTSIGDDGFRQIRRDVGTTDMRVEFVLGGDGTGEPSEKTQSYILGRMSPDGKRAICVQIRKRNLYIGGWSWTGAFKTPPTLDGNPFFLDDIGLVDPRPVLSEGVRYSLDISGDRAILRLADTGRAILFKEGINSIVPANSGNTWAGAMVMRNLFANSVSIGEMRLYT